MELKSYKKYSLFKIQWNEKLKKLFHMEIKEKLYYTTLEWKIIRNIKTKLSKI